MPLQLQECKTNEKKKIFPRGNRVLETRFPVIYLQKCHFNYRYTKQMKKKKKKFTSGNRVLETRFPVIYLQKCHFNYSNAKQMKKKKISQWKSSFTNSISSNIFTKMPLQLQ